MSKATRAFTVFCVLVALGCGDEESAQQDAGMNRDGGGGGGGNNSCTETFTFCTDNTMRAYDVCYSPGNTSCWYENSGNRYTCSSCSTADGCTSAANALLAAVCN